MTEFRDAWKKIGLSAVVIISFIIYALRQHFPDDDEVGPIKAASTNSPVTSIQPTQLSTVKPTPTPNGKYKDGQYTGTVADAFYGPLQIKAIISGGRLTDVQFLQYPNDRRTSVEINTQAMPLLKQEAISAQSAQVNGVTGASASSQAFVESLGSALQQAI